MRKINVRTLHGHKIYSAFPFDVYVAKTAGKSYYIQLSRGTTSLNKEVKKTTFNTKAEAEKVAKKWIRAKVEEYDAKERLKDLRYGKRR